MQALQAGIPNIDPSHFNPYTTIDQVAQALGTNLKLTGTLNQSFSKSLNHTHIMTMDFIKEQTPYKETEEIRKDLIETKAFDDIVKKLALFILNKNITFNQVNEFISQLENNQANLRTTANTTQDRGIVKAVATPWAEAFPDKPLKDFFRALKSLHSQATESD